jgi:hypothetical protein
MEHSPAINTVLLLKRSSDVGISAKDLADARSIVLVRKLPASFMRIFDIKIQSFRKGIRDLRKNSIFQFPCLFTIYTPLKKIAEL